MIQANDEQPWENLIITGGRDFEDNELFIKMVKYFFGGQLVRIIFGDCPTGADRLAKNYAKGKGLPHEEFIADWDKYGNPAGPIRNGEMAKVGKYCLAFWDRNSKGTGDMIKKAGDKKIPTIIIYY